LKFCGVSESLRPELVRAARIRDSRHDPNMTHLPMNSIVITPATKTQRQTFPWGELTWLASGSVGNQNDITVGRCVLKAGHENPLHYHPNCSEVLVVAQGTIEHTAAGGSVAVMRAGDVASIPPNVVHHARNIGTDDAVVWISFSSAARETVGDGVGTAPLEPLRVSDSSAAPTAR
jgi:quercetin dioxygenase-like cupin family protein